MLENFTKSGIIKADGRETKMGKELLRFLAFGDLMGRRDFLSGLLSSDLSHYDFALFTGDISDTKVFIKLSQIAAEKGIKLDEGEDNLAKQFEIKEILDKQMEQFKEMGKLLRGLAEKVPLYAVWGNGDLVKMISKISDYFALQSLHLEVVEVKGVGLVGYEGRPIYIFEKRNPDQRAFREKAAEEELACLFDQRMDLPTILVTHSPPYMTLDQVKTDVRKYALESYGDRAKNGHIGSIAFKNITTKYKPILHIFGHIDEGRGIVKKEGTLFVNTGPSGENGDFVEVAIENLEIEAKFVKLR